MTDDLIHSRTEARAISPPLDPKETAGEDVNRKPGGFPHRMIAATALLVVLTVGLLFIALRASSIAAFVMAAVVVVVGIIVVRRESSRERDHIHPSR
mgnify:CR=1 FL=1